MNFFDWVKQEISDIKNTISLFNSKSKSIDELTELTESNSNIYIAVYDADETSESKVKKYKLVNTSSIDDSLNSSNIKTWSIDQLLNEFAKINGNENETFLVDDATTEKMAINKSQFDTAINALKGSNKIQGNWNANSNTPDITGTTETGYYWIINTDGTTDLGGISDWKINDWVIKTDNGWAKVDNTDSVLSVAGKKGVVTLVVNDITDFNQYTKTKVGTLWIDRTENTDKTVNEVGNIFEGKYNGSYIIGAIKTLPFDIDNENTWSPIYTTLL
tara:strand:- start:1158 stop:1982 length:825 start_codon:yes stop_codon:yes gene_type:complete